MSSLVSDHQKHAPEPWTLTADYGDLHIADATNEPIFGSDAYYPWVHRDSFARIVACVNAMQGIPDPASFVSAARGVVREHDNAGSPGPAALSHAVSALAAFSAAQEPTP